MFRNSHNNHNNNSQLSLGPIITARSKLYKNTFNLCKIHFKTKGKCYSHCFLKILSPSDIIANITIIFRSRDVKICVTRGRLGGQECISAKRFEVEVERSEQICHV